MCSQPAEGEGKHDRQSDMRGAILVELERAIAETKRTGKTCLYSAAERIQTRFDPCDLEDLELFLIVLCDVLEREPWAFVRLFAGGEGQIWKNSPNVMLRDIFAEIDRKAEKRKKRLRKMTEKLRCQLGSDAPPGKKQKTTQL